MSDPASPSDPIPARSANPSDPIPARSANPSEPIPVRPADPGGPTPAPPAPPSDPAAARRGIDEVVQNAARAFDLLPAGPEDSGSGQGQSAAQRLKTDPDTVERDLMKLVLTIVELLRQLMERTALHRVDHGDLTEEQEERIGLTLMTLQDRMEELCDRYGLTLDDLNLDLGPLGSLM